VLDAQALGQPRPAIDPIPIWPTGRRAAAGPIRLAWEIGCALGVSKGWPPFLPARRTCFEDKLKFILAAVAKTLYKFSAGSESGLWAKRSNP
jgi:hypothetical protein